MEFKNKRLKELANILDQTISLIKVTKIVLSKKEKKTILVRKKKKCCFDMKVNYFFKKLCF